MYIFVNLNSVLLKVICLEWEIQGENKNWRNNILRKQYTTHNHSKNTESQKVHFGVHHIR